MKEKRGQSDTADAGYDSESNHAFARRERHVRSIIPARHGRPTEKPASGHYRRLMQTRFNIAAYRDRVQMETVISMIKRRLEGSSADATSGAKPRSPLESPHPQRRDSVANRAFLHRRNVLFLVPFWFGRYS